MRVAASISVLGAGRFPYEEAMILGAGEQWHAFWHASPGVWATQPETAIWHGAPDIMVDHNEVSAAGALEYLSLALDPANDRSEGWQPSTLRRPDLAYAAGLVQWCRMDAWCGSEASGTYQLAWVDYELDEHGRIDPEIVPEDHVSVALTCPVADRQWATTGWVASSIATPVARTLSPHLYTAWLSGAKSLLRVHAAHLQRRLVGAP